MTSRNIEQPSSTCVNLKEANEIPVNISTAQLKCANLESMAIIINPKPQTSENTPHLVAVNQNKDTKTYECKDCHKNFTTVPYLQEHMKSHTKLFTCWICDETFSLMTQLTSHLKNCSKHQKSMHCSTCDKTFEFPALFKQHELIYHPEGRPRGAFAKKQVLVQNMQQYIGNYCCQSSEIFKSKHSNDKRCCPICQKQFSSTYGLQTHALMHEFSNFFCVVCPKEFTTTKVDFKIHMQQHIQKNQPPFKCEHCPKEFRRRSTLWSHYRVVHPPKRVNVTNETDSRVAMVKKTVAENNILPASDTPSCNRGISELIKETHAKKFTCSECQKAFKAKYALLEHLPLHEIRKFICVVCHKEFKTTKIDFKMHMQQHCTPDNRGRFNCEHCLRSYTHKKALISHYRVKHPPKRDVNEKEGSENCERIQQIPLVKSEPNESDSTIMHYEIKINEMAEDEEDNNLLELEKAAHNEKFCEGNELTEHVSSMKSVPSSPESKYVNLKDDEITVEEIDVKTETITHNDIIITKDNNLIELEKPVSYEENELTELVSSMKSVPSSPESKYVNLEDDNITVKEIDVKTENITHNEIMIKEDNNFIELEKPASYEKNELVSSIKSVPSSPESKYVNDEDNNITVKEIDVKTENITHNEIMIKEDNNFIELEKPASYEENELTELVSSMKSVPSSPESSYVNLEDDEITEEINVKTETITHNDIIIKKTLEDNNLLQLEKAAYNEKFCEENEITELVSSMKSLESAYINLEDNKFIIEETNVKTDESKAELNNPLPALIRSCPVMVKSNDPCLVDVDQNQHRKFYVCQVCHEVYRNASHLHQHFMKKHVYSLCWICGERFLNDQFASHIETHVRMYTCKLCDKSFLHQSVLEVHKNTSHRSQNRLKWYNKLYSCKVCGKRFVTMRFLKKHLKTHTEDESTCVSKQVVANETQTSIGTVTCRKVKRGKRKTVKKREDVTLTDPLDVNVPVNDKDFCEQSELSDLMDLSEKSELCELITSEPSSLKSGKTSQRNNAQSSLDLLILPESDPIDLNVPNDKDSVQSELTELKDSIKSDSSPPNSWLSSCKICGKRFITERHLENHWKTHTEDESTCVSKQGVADETESSIGMVTRRKVKRLKRITVPLNRNVPVKSSIGTVTRRKVKRLKRIKVPLDMNDPVKSSIGTVTGRKTKRLKRIRVPLDMNVPVNDKNFFKQSELTELKDSIKSDSPSPNSWPSSLNSYRSSWRNNSQSASSGLLILPESDPIDQNVSESNKKICEKPELNELVTRVTDAAEGKPCSSVSCMSSQKTHSPSSSNGNIVLQLSRVHSFKHLNMAKKAVFSGKLVKVKNAVDKQKTRQKFLFMLKLLKKTEPQKQHEPESHTENRGDTVRCKEFCEQSELNEIVDAELVDTEKIEPLSPESQLVDATKYEPSSPKSPYYYVKSELEEPVDAAKYEPSSPESPYYYVKSELEEPEDAANYEPSSSESPYYYVKSELEEPVDICGKI